MKKSLKINEVDSLGMGDPKVCLLVPASSALLVPIFSETWFSAFPWDL